MQRDGRPPSATTFIDATSLPPPKAGLYEGRLEHVLEDMATNAAIHLQASPKAATAATRVDYDVPSESVLDCSAPLDDLYGSSRPFSQQALRDLRASQDVCDASGYKQPGQDNTRQQYHAWFKEAERCGDTDAGGEGLKNAISSFENSWYIAAALMMTVGFALITLKPEGQHPGSLGDRIAMLAFIVLVLAGTVNAVLGVWWAGHQVPQVHWHPAAHMSKFWFASMNTTLGHAQQFAKIAVEQLVLSLVPLCYLNHGVAGLLLAAASVGYMRLQLWTWANLSQQMRTAYQQGIEGGRPVAINVSDVPEPSRMPYTEGLIGLVTCQLIGSTCFATRWMRGHTQANTYEMVVDVEA